MSNITIQVSQKLSEKDVIDHADTLSFPSSVLEYYQGYLGEPPYGFPEPLRTRILEAKRLQKIHGRPGASMQPMDFDRLRDELFEKHGRHNITETDVLSAALYPKVFDEYRDVKTKFGDLSVIPTVHFLTPMKIGQEFSFELETGKLMIIHLVAVGPLNEATGKRDLYFKLNGEARIISVSDESESKETKNGLKAVVRAKADSKDKFQIGAPMSGVVVEIRVKSGSVVKLGDPVAVMSAMKMETIVTASQAGVISDVFVVENDSINAGDLIAKIEKK